MLSRLDDYPIHQTPDPIAMPATGDKDFYERYWFNGYSTDADMYFGIGTAYYPHLGIRDAGVSIVVDGHQHAFHASARAEGDPSEMHVGPFHLEIVEPMRSLRVTIDDNETGWSGEFVFEGRTGSIEEPRHHFVRGLRRVMDTTRFTQLGRWSGSLDYRAGQITFDPEETLGTKDRSWGVRDLAGGDPRMAPTAPGSGGVFFLWAPLHFDDRCVHYQLFEDPDGRPIFSVGAILPTHADPAAIPGVEDPGVRHARNLEHRLTFAPDSRMIRTATLAFTTIDDGERHEIEFERRFTYRMKGIGYGHPEWSHGAWKGELALGAESWALADVDETAFANQHVQHMMKVTMDGDAGVGVLEQILLGPHHPYGLTGVLDPPR